MNPRTRAGIAQLEVRRRHLYLELPRPPDLALQALLARTCEQLEAIEQQIEELLTAARYQREDAHVPVMRRFRNIARELQRIESFPMVVLSRWSDDDMRLTRFTGRVCTEAGFPRQQPVTVGLSQSYYASLARFNLIVTPAAEGSFLLHLPDIYHELGHLLLASERDPRSAPALSALALTTRTFTSHCLAGARREAASSRPPHRIEGQFYHWARCYPDWAVEFACDVFAVATCGPSYARAHTHLWTKDLRDPWEPSLGSHPADAARHECMVEVLRLCDFDDEARDIEREWEMLTGAAGFSPGAPYRRCFPRALLRQTSAQLLKGFREVGLKISTPHTLGPVGTRLAEAWERFAEDDAEAYRQWELETGEELFGG